MSMLAALERRLWGLARRLTSGRRSTFIRRREAQSTPRSRVSAPDHPSARAVGDRPDERTEAHMEHEAHVEHADERTIRRAGEAELGGTSTAESRAAYERGLNPGGLHHGGKGPQNPRERGEPEE